ncbi:TniQ family protein [Pandoraea pnomenusa]|uniref:TniQ family protein n=1 Tax=Pandoraea pnomenusa TaxID=93220 RepID=UPI00333F0DE6
MSSHAFRLHHALPVAPGWSYSSREPVLGAGFRNQIVRFCSACFREHRREVGRPIWRRGHQLIGVHICAEHDVPLMTVSGFCPSRVLPDPKSMEGTRARCFSSSSGFEAVRNYAAAAGFLVQELGGGRVYRHALNRLKSVFQLRASEMGLVTQAEDCPGTYLSDVVFECLPESWLVDEFGKSLVKSPGEYFYPIDDIANAGRFDSYVAGPLALALMFRRDEWRSLLLPQIEAIREDLWGAPCANAGADVAEIELHRRLVRSRPEG